MSEEDKLFNFMSGLKLWAQLELRRQGVKDLASAMAAADGLVDLRIDKAGGNNKGKSKDSSKGKGKSKWDKGKVKGGSEGESSSEGNQKGKKDARTSGCFICDGPHRARDCPKREKLAAMIAESGEDSSESENVVRVNPLQLLNALSTEKGKGTPLMYFDAFINNHGVAVMLDTGATHSFVGSHMVETLGLKVDRDTSKVKAVNSKALGVSGMASGVAVQVGDWKGKLDLMVVPLDDFDVILGIDFGSGAKVAVLPYLGGMLIMDEDSPSFVRVRGK